MRPATPVLLLAAACALPTSVHAQATFTGLGMLQGAESCYARFLSADGLTASGYCFLDQEFTNHAFRWRSGSIQDLGVPQGYFSSEGGPLNADGSIMAAILGLSQRPGRWTEATGTMVDLGFPPDTNHIPLTISEDGSTVWGFGGSHPITPRVFRWTAATSLQYLPLPAGYSASGGGHATADGSIIVGAVLSNGLARPVRWVNGVPSLLTLPPGMIQGNAAAVSANGLVIVGTMDDGTSNRMMRWTQAGGMQNLGGENAVGLDTNADGSVIVGRSVIGGLYAASFWTSQAGIVDLNAYLPSLGVDLTGWRLDGAGSVSHDGRTILGQGTHNGIQEPWLVRLPAPCYANCDESTLLPVLTGNDFLCFISRYATGDARANCDGSTVAPTLNANDFVCFITKYVVGCS